MTTITDVLEGRARWCVITGDCLEVMATLPDRSVQHVITDPPYEAEAHTKQRRTLKDATQRAGVENRGDVRWLDPVLPFAAITAEERRLAAQHIGRLVERWALAFCQIEAIAAWKADLIAGGLEWIRGGVWHKPDGMPQFTGDRPGQGHESIAIAHPPGRKRWNGGGKHGFWSVPLDHAHGAGGKSDHPTTKPLALMLALVADFTDPNDVVLDPYCGSGTTGVAALRLGRRAILIEKKPKWADLARERMAAEDTGSTLQAARAGQEPLFAAGPK